MALRFPDHFGWPASVSASPTRDERRVKRWVAVTQRCRSIGIRFVGWVGAWPAVGPGRSSLRCGGASERGLHGRTSGIDRRDTPSRPTPRGGRGDCGQIQRVGGLPADWQAAGHVVSWRGWGVSTVAECASWEAKGPNEVVSGTPIGPVSGTRIKESHMSPRSCRSIERTVAVARCLMLLAVGIAVLATAMAHAG